MPSRLRRTSIASALVLVGTLVLLAGYRGTETTAPAGPNRVALGPTVTLAVGGDVLLGEDVNAFVARQGAAAALRGVPELKEADLAIVNLESVVAPGADAVDSGRIGDLYFLGRPEALGVLEAAGIDLVTTANNHALDFGAAALAAEDHLLTTMQLAHPGTGTPAEACTPAYLASGNLRIAVFSINTSEPSYAARDGQIGTCYLAPGDRDGWKRTYGPAFAEARRRAHVILAMPHFRPSFSTTPHPADRALAQLLIDLGADAVLGIGTHSLQGIELRDGRPILHSAGSLLFNFPEPDRTAIFMLTLSAAGVEAIRTVPLIAERGWTRQASPAEAAEILAAIDARSRALGAGAIAGSLELAPSEHDPPTGQPEFIERLDAGPAPGRTTMPAAACTAAAVPVGAAVTPTAVGPLTILGARVERDRMAGPALIWLETFWRIDARTALDLSINPRAVPQRGTPWSGPHEPCDWAWPTSRWEPGVIYRDRYPLRPPREVVRLGGLPAVLSMSGYGTLDISVQVQVEDRSLGESDVLATVVLDPAEFTRFIIAAGLTTAGVLVVAVVGWRRKWARRVIIPLVAVAAVLGLLAAGRP